MLGWLEWHVLTSLTMGMPARHKTFVFLRTDGVSFRDRWRVLPQVMGIQGMVGGPGDLGMPLGLPPQQHGYAPAHSASRRPPAADLAGRSATSPEHLSWRNHETIVMDSLLCWKKSFEL